MTLAYVSIEGLTKTFTGKAPTTVISELDIDIEDGEFVVLLGPSGCGKTTILRCIAGLEEPNMGRISLNGQIVFDRAGNVNLPPDKRNIGMVFQSYALWPHMTVRRNIEYPLRARGLKPEIKSGRVDDTARLVNLEPALLDRYPAKLSGGQQQRVALARGLVARPDLVLFDEPLSNLDAALRDTVRAQLHELHARHRFTSIFVTHDQSEALALGDRLAIMRAGSIEQLDTPRHIFERPATEYVAEFVGMSNLLACRRRDNGWVCEGEPFAGEPLAIPGSGDRSAVRLRLRPDDLWISRVEEPPAPGMTTIAATVEDAQYGGRHINVAVSVGGRRLHAHVPVAGWGGWEQQLAAGQRVRLGFRAGNARCYDDASQPGPAVPEPDVAEQARV